MALALVSHPACLRHETGPGHPERPERLAAVHRGALAAALGDALVEVEAPRATPEQLLRVHAADYVDLLERRAPASGLLYWDPDTAMGPHSLEAALRAAGAAVHAVDLVLGGRADSAFCNVRPPGHHALRAQAMGFCLFNNVAVAAAHALAAHGVDRVAIADFDVHHGNGTEEAFAGHPQVLLCSSFQAGIYPGATLEGAANVVKTPLAAGAGSEAFRRHIERDWLARLSAFQPQLLLVSAGFDGHAADPLAGLALQAEDFEWITLRLREAVAPSAATRVVSTLEGGYDLDALAESAEAHVRALGRGAMG